MAPSGLHEDLHRDEEIVGPSNRKFGLTIGVVFAALAIWKLIYWSSWFYLWTVSATLLIAFALLRPATLAPLNTAWLKLGLLLYRVVNPMVMAVLFYGTVLPIGVILRASGKDVLRLKWDRKARSYWIARTEERPVTESMRQQF
jgi:hypothetical protein